MDWFVLLTPLFVLILLPPVIVVGCGLQEHGEGVTAARSLVLDFHVPDTEAGKLNQLLVDFQLTQGNLKDTVHGQIDLQTQVEHGTKAFLDHGLFMSGTKVSCTCTVTFVGWQQVLPPSPLPSPPCGETDDTITFTLGWDPLVWNQPLKTYNDVHFTLTCA